MNNINIFFDNLPDDIIDFIYTKIYYKQNKEILQEIKLMYYINNKLVNDYSLDDICFCALLHMRDGIMENINIEEIEYVNNFFNKLNYNEFKTFLNKILASSSILKKYSFIFYMNDVKFISNNNINEYYIKNYVNRLIKKFMDDN